MTSIKILNNTTKTALQFRICTQYGIKQYLPEQNNVLMSQQVLSIFNTFFYYFVLALHIVKAISQEFFDTFSSNLAQTQTMIIIIFLRSSAL